MKSRDWKRIERTEKRVGGYELTSAGLVLVTHGEKPRLRIVGKVA